MLEPAQQGDASGAIFTNGIKQTHSQHNRERAPGKADFGEWVYLMNTTGQTDISGLAPLIEKLPFVEKTLLYADLFDLSPPHKPLQERLFYDWSQSSADNPTHNRNRGAHAATRSHPNGSGGALPV
jgi:hypothetical protein